MDLYLDFKFLDVAFLVTVLAQCAVVASVRSPRWKAIAMAIPIPFTMASIALGEPIGARHAAGIVVFMFFVHAVRLLRERRFPIVPAIVVSALGYAAAATGLKRVIPLTPAAFWTAAALAFVAPLIILALMPHRREPSHRTPLTVWVKLPIMACVLITILVLKKTLGGFMTTFPMVSVIACYEARHSLWSMCRQTSVFVASFAPALVVVRLLQGSWGLGWAFLPAWIVFLSLLVPFSWAVWFREGRAARLDRDSAD